jgi:hypothetical protein
MRIAWGIALGCGVLAGCGAKTTPADGPAPAIADTATDVGAPDVRDVAGDTRGDVAPAGPDAGVERAGAPPDGPSSAPCTGGTGFDTTITGVALDRASCLAWERNDPPRDKGPCLIARDSEAKLCFEAAVAYCAALRLDGKSDWRLPTTAELRTIVVPTAYPAVDKTIFPQALISLYWTSERNGEKVICLDFSNAGMLNDHIGPDGPQGLRCVRGAR